MKNSNLANSDSKDNTNESADKNKVNSQLNRHRKKLKKEIESLNYEESLIKLDQVIKRLQNENVQLEQLQILYLEASIHIEHCENLLSKVEQEVIQINLEELE